MIAAHFVIPVTKYIVFVDLDGTSTYLHGRQEKIMEVEFRRMILLATVQASCPKLENYFNIKFGKISEGVAVLLIDSEAALFKFGLSITIPKISCVKLAQYQT